MINLTDDKCRTIIDRLDAYGRNYDNSEYGLPNHRDYEVNHMIEIIKGVFSDRENIEVNDEALNRLMDERDSIKESLATLRDQFASCALTGFISFGATEYREADWIANSSYEIADAMMEARKK